MKDYSAQACTWIKQHRKEWRDILSVSRRLHTQGRKISRDNIFTFALLNGMDISACEIFRRDHNLWSSFTRYMVMLDPHLYPSIEFHDAAIDRMPLEENWRSIVNSGQTFLASSWKEARDLFEMKDTSAT